MSAHQTLQEYNGKRPTLASDAFVAPNASVVGDVTLGKGSSVWYGAILRGKEVTLLQGLVIAQACAPALTKHAQET